MARRCSPAPAATRSAGGASIPTSLALRQLGAEIELGDNVYRLTLPGRFKGAEVFLDEASVTATENAVMAACVRARENAAFNAASEPHVQGLCHALNAMGAKVRGIGTNALEIEGVEALAPATHRIGPDHIEIGSFVALAAMTGGELRVLDVAPEHLRMIRLVFARLGLETQLEGTALVVPGGQRLAVSDDLGGAIPTVDDAPWPGFPADLTPMALVLATQCAGTVLIHEKLFESRLFFVDRLIDMERGSSCVTRTGRWWLGRAGSTERRWCRPRDPRGHGAPGRRSLRARDLPHPQHAPDRPRLRADR